MESRLSNMQELANRKTSQPECSPKEGSVPFGEDMLDPPLSITEINVDTGATWHELQPSHAVNQLEALFCQQATQENEVSLSRRQNVPSLEKLKLPYEEKREMLEPQLEFLRKCLAGYQEDCEEFKGQLLQKETLIADNMSSYTGGLCLKCAQHEAVLSQTHNNVHLLTIQRLTKERDDLMSALASVRSSLTDVQQREASAYEQVKQAVQMTEDANLEKTKTLIQCEQLKNELEKQTERLEKLLASQQEKRTFEKEVFKKEITKEREDMKSKMLALSENIAQLEANVEKVTREKIAATNQLEEIQKKLASQEVEAAKVFGEMRYQLNKIKMEKDDAEKEHKEYQTKTKRDLAIKSQETEKLRLELSESKQHLEEEHQKVALAGEECLKLTELLSKSEHQLHLSRLEKDSIRQKFSSEAKAQALQAQQREQELTQKIQQMEAQHDKTENEQFSLMISQNTILKKLKEECCTLAEKLEQIYQKNRSKIFQFSQEKKYICEKLEKLQRRNNELEKQCVQHGILHEKMKQRLIQLDKYSQVTAQQLVQVLSTQNQFLLKQQNLPEDVEHLQAQEPYQIMKVDQCSSQLSSMPQRTGEQTEAKTRFKGASLSTHSHWKP
ncbi:serologically defined colon cancer antigen 8 isoform X2 [Sorex araneus]|uniref:serologically defined colon cancer antigen 8 isoform X2 n=1 Tax=Sorex araneus TaxID=42254 RepID=UPI002433629C|nr:serologically defined colon cancer antigen 8 isoform X2 [Sorex araneus]